MRLMLRIRARLGDTATSTVVALDKGTVQQRQAEASEHSRLAATEIFAPIVFAKFTLSG
jgi:hypothetical protein